MQVMPVKSYIQRVLSEYVLNQIIFTVHSLSMFRKTLMAVQDKQLCQVWASHWGFNFDSVIWDVNTNDKSCVPEGLSPHTWSWANL